MFINHPDLLVIHHHPLFQIAPVLDNNLGLSLSEPLQLYQKHWTHLLATWIPYVQDSAR